ncbi:MAG TPA: methyltransferase domain-containing protein, partial [Acidimicrobiales bacterium]|nr:methyltransferase domain-containing protein [Acidimicrobiales bacterium]
MTDTETVRRLFDTLAHEYDQQLPFFATFGSELVAWCRLQTGWEVLDVAAGRGAIAGPAARAVGERGRVVAIDNSARMLAALAIEHQGLPQLTPRLMDAHRLDLPDRRFDAVTCGFTLHFLNDPARAIAEVYRVLRPGGLFAFSGPPTGRADDGGEGPAPGRDERWAFYGPLISEMATRSDPDKKPDPFTPPPRRLPELCREAGFTGLEQRWATASFALRDAQHFWDWNMSHGFRGFVESLGARLAEEFRARVFAGLEPMQAEGGIFLTSVVAFNRMIKPG